MGKYNSEWQKYKRIVGAYMPDFWNANADFFAACDAADIKPPEPFGHASGSKGTDPKAELARTKTNMERYTAWLPGAKEKLKEAVRRSEEAIKEASEKPKVYVSPDTKREQLVRQEAERVGKAWKKHKDYHVRGCSVCRPIQSDHEQWHTTRGIPTTDCTICAEIKRLRA